MATHTITGPERYTASLSASTVDTVVLPSGTAAVAIVNRTGSAAITVNMNGENPTVGGTARFEHLIPAGGTLTVPLVPNYANEVRLISSGTPEYAVSPAPNRLQGVELEFTGGHLTKAEVEALA